MKTTELFVEQTLTGFLVPALATGAVLAAISAWAWWRTTGTFMQFLRDFRTWAKEK